MSKIKVVTDKGFTNTNIDMDSDDTCESFVKTTSSCSYQVPGLCLMSSSSIALHSEKHFVSPEKAETVCCNSSDKFSIGLNAQLENQFRKTNI